MIGILHSFMVAGEYLVSVPVEALGIIVSVFRDIRALSLK